MEEKKKIKMTDIIRPASAPSNSASANANKDDSFFKSLKEKKEKNKEKTIKEFEQKFEEFEKKEIDKFKEEDKEKIERKAKKRKLYRKLVFASLVLALILAIAVLIPTLMAKTKIKIITKKNEWNYIDSVVASKNTGEINASLKQIPAEIFSQKKNFNFSFQATGKRNIERKASGKIIIYNAYSSNVQKLVSGTRISSPDGKIFRLNAGFIVPGAKITDGKIVPSSVEAEIIADEPGEKYNIGSVGRFSIPGFEGSPKYQGFYAESKEPMKGGFIGEESFPTEEDVKKARLSAAEDLKKTIESFLILQIPRDFKIIDGGKQFTVGKEEISQSPDEKGNYGIFMEGDYSIIVFKESDIKNLFEKLAEGNIRPEFKLKTYKLEYGAPRLDIKVGQISFAVNFYGIFEKPINISDFKKSVAGKKEGELKDIIYSVSDIEKATISFWPRWIKKVPLDEEKIEIEIQ